MLNTVYRLTAPRRFEVAFTDLNLFGDDVLVRPTYLSICHADQRYYQGTRDAAVLAQKLPMALIHEGIGEVVYDPTHTMAAGTKVVMIPNQPAEQDALIAENYLRTSRFAGSSCDGFLQEYVPLKPDRLVPLPAGIHENVAAFTELVSVSMHAISRFARFA
ncbi:MAG: alcohol dehydrogenase catalytic domain-containing protein, partial [Hominenteromicrobium sp.]